MKKILFFILTAALMLNCGNKTGKAVSDTDSLSSDTIADAGIDKHSEDYIRQRIGQATVVSAILKPAENMKARSRSGKATLNIVMVPD